MSVSGKTYQSLCIWSGLTWCGIGLLAFNGCESNSKPETAEKRPAVAEVEVMEVNQDNFDAQVLKSSLPVLIDFWAPWCGPCLQMAPLIEELAQEFNGKVRMVKIDIDQNPELNRKYVGGQGIPLLLIFKNGEPVGYANGIGPGTKRAVTKFLNTLDQLPEKKKTDAETPEEDKSSEYKNSDKQSSEQKPSDDKPVDAKANSEKAIGEKATDEKAAEGKPAVSKDKN